MINPMRHLARLRRNRSGVAMTEFALGAPVLLLASMWGAEHANYVLINMKIGQLAIHIADNASRVGDTSQLKYRKIYESDINDVIIGAQVQSGKSVDLYKNGRIIISSLQTEGPAGAEKQYIKWQRCRGAKNVTSSYGTEGEFLADGIGPDGKEVVAEPGDAVIFVEINYTYQPLISSSIVPKKDIRSIASFTVRDNRDLTQIYQRIPAKPDPIQRCNVFSGEVMLSSKGDMS